MRVMTRMSVVMVFSVRNSSCRCSVSRIMTFVMLLRATVFSLPLNSDTVAYYGAGSALVLSSALFAKPSSCTEIRDGGATPAAAGELLLARASPQPVLVLVLPLVSLNGDPSCAPAGGA